MDDGLPLLPPKKETLPLVVVVETRLTGANPVAAVLVVDDSETGVLVLPTVLEAVAPDLVATPTDVVATAAVGVVPSG